MMKPAFLFLMFFFSSAAFAAEESKPMTEVPTLNHSMKYGEIIGENDIAIKEFPQVRVYGSAITSADDLIGKTPKRAVSPGRIIRKGEIINKALIEKGDTVNMLYKSSTMEVSTVGEAMEKGGMGDNIKIKNTKSGVIVTGIVSGKNQVNINPPGND